MREKTKTIPCLALLVVLLAIVGCTSKPNNTQAQPKTISFEQGVSQLEAYFKQEGVAMFRYVNTPMPNEDTYKVPNKQALERLRTKLTDFLRELQFYEESTDVKALRALTELYIATADVMLTIRRYDQETLNELREELNKVSKLNSELCAGNKIEDLSRLLAGMEAQLTAVRELNIKVKAFISAYPTRAQYLNIKPFSNQKELEATITELRNAQQALGSFYKLCETWAEISDINAKLSTLLGSEKEMCENSQKIQEMLGKLIALAYQEQTTLGEMGRQKAIEQIRLDEMRQSVSKAVINLMKAEQALVEKCSDE
jgi:hypothetical protein